jgi:hypothetical protein
MGLSEGLFAVTGASRGWGRGWGREAGAWHAELSWPGRFKALGSCHGLASGVDSARRAEAPWGLPQLGKQA